MGVVQSTGDPCLPGTLQLFWYNFPGSFALFAELIEATNILFKSHFIDVIRLINVMCP